MPFLPRRPLREFLLDTSRDTFAGLGLQTTVEVKLLVLARRFVVLPCLAALASCASIPNRPPRLERSSYECMQAVVRDKLPADLPDKRAHCLAAGLIARYCSVSEAYLAGSGKELRDLVGVGDAQWSDWRADRAGIGCARKSQNDSDIALCCANSNY